MDRRLFLSLVASASAGLFVQPAIANARGRVVVVGGGFGGATAAKYLKAFAPELNVTLLEPGERFYSCPLSCRVLLGAMGMRELSQSYASFAKQHAVTWMRDAAVSINNDKREVITKAGKRLAYDRLIVAPGVDFDYSALSGLELPEAQERMPHAWKAGDATMDLKRRLNALKEGDVVAIHVPKAPFRATAAPYERACIIATLMQERNLKGKVLVFDANADIVSGKELFSTAWRERYPNHIEYIPNATITRVSASNETVEFGQQGRVRAALWNIIPPQRAGRIAIDAGLATADQRWCSVDFTTYESTTNSGVHVLGDAVAGSPGMPKSAHMANQEAKVCAMAIARLLAGESPVAKPYLISAAYSFVSRRHAAHFSRVFQFDPEKKIMIANALAGGNSTATQLEGIYAMGWLSNILGDTFN
jgi:sulfide dehydrogenase [flavocytochrome c] flavoprotein chain